MNLQEIKETYCQETFTTDKKRPKKVQKLSFAQLKISNKLLKAVSKLGFTHPTPIQEQAIPHGIDGKDIVALAQTGSGKTLAYGIPIIQNMLTDKSGTSLILVPTRELALQVEDSLRGLLRAVNLRSAVLIGGASMGIQISILKKNPRVIIATPGRLMDHIERRTVNMNYTNYFVLDEADRMLDMGFVKDIKKIIKSCKNIKQTLLFSATMPNEVKNIANTLMVEPLYLEIDKSGTTPQKISHEMIMVQNHEKGQILANRLNECEGPVLVFTRTKRMATKLSIKINQMGFSSAEIHSDRSQAQRQRALEGFKKGRHKILVATDIAARGIDVSNIELVVNYDMPANSEDYIHRIGRTGRAGKNGQAISFATNAQRGSIREIERALDLKLLISSAKQALPLIKKKPVPAPQKNDDAQKIEKKVTKKQKPETKIKKKRKITKKKSNSQGNPFEIFMNGNSKKKRFKRRKAS